MFGTTQFRRNSHHKPIITRSLIRLRWRHASVVLPDTSVAVVAWTGWPGGTHANDCSTRCQQRRDPAAAYEKSEDLSTFGLA